MSAIVVAWSHNGLTVIVCAKLALNKPKMFRWKRLSVDAVLDIWTILMSYFCCFSPAIPPLRSPTIHSASQKVRRKTIEKLQINLSLLFFQTRVSSIRISWDTANRSLSFLITKTIKFEEKSNKKSNNKLSNQTTKNYASRKKLRVNLDWAWQHFAGRTTKWEISI